ncbi:hypothetical protein, partial [Stenotrophomonas maltophilia]|uniref:hypothetical protein n=1 Tax=Stenotrophomonas maltophilia TaxID=40324 RepID=UPI001954AD82
LKAVRKAGTIRQSGMDCLLEGGRDMKCRLMRSDFRWLAQVEFAQHVERLGGEEMAFCERL